jgi:hypothetical protein
MHLGAGMTQFLEQGAADTEGVSAATIVILEYVAPLVGYGILIEIIGVLAVRQIWRCWRRRRRRGE